MNATEHTTYNGFTFNVRLLHPLNYRVGQHLYYFKTSIWIGSYQAMPLLINLYSQYKLVTPADQRR